MLIPWEMLREDKEESNNLLEKLLEIAAADPLLFGEVVRGILHDDPFIQVQAATMVEKVTCVRPLFLTLYKRLMINEFSAIEQPQVRRVVALLYGRVLWDEWEMKQVVTLLKDWIENDKDKEVRENSINSLQTLDMQNERRQAF
ncbi:hypothetical protein [Pelosinus sp. IPA-1]|uniref:hypothetical protein n=1 Tax=Pelosinus sp. IPA-1 TaxID=3029569 RepID=UPI002436260C|nr:hypothetical protein [Pelosinus sp. IPA-1]GMB00785.1 hypothetical protein PIPA1_35840 [Pelosinus sp. IPA-1]